MTQAPAPRPRDAGTDFAPAPSGWSTSETLLTLWRHRRALVGIPLGIGIVVALVSLLLPNKYTAGATILPETQSTFAGGNIGQIAASFGVSIGRSATRLTDLYPAMITSERILRPVLYQRFATLVQGDSTTLLTFLRLATLDSAKAYDRGLRRLRQRVLDVSQDRRTSIISLYVTLPDPVVAANVANAVTAQLDSFVRQFQRTQASDQVLWIETRLAQVEDELRRSEVALKTFREGNRLIATSPQLQLQEGRLVRDVNTNTTVYVELRRQLELAKIDAVKNIPVVQLLDRARPPIRKSSPRRQILTLGAMLLTALGVVAVTLGLNRLELEPDGSGALLLRQIRADIGIRWARVRRRSPG